MHPSRRITERQKQFTSLSNYSILQDNVGSRIDSPVAVCFWCAGIAMHKCQPRLEALVGASRSIEASEPVIISDQDLISS
jgi:hypothetical protein